MSDQQIQDAVREAFELNGVEIQKVSGTHFDQTLMATIPASELPEKLRRAIAEASAAASGSEVFLQIKG